MELTDINVISGLLKEFDFSFKKGLGQNFLSDATVCPFMADVSTDSESGVLEIGPGFGVLTKELALKAKKVVSVELDERLKPVLKKTLADFDNVEIIFADVMKLDMNALFADHFADCKRVTVCANLPYYITSPIITGILESGAPFESITVMVQKEAAERICADVGTRDSGVLTVTVNCYAEGEMLKTVPRTSFVPAPKVDSSVIKLTLRKTPLIPAEDADSFFKFVKACFAQRRKTLVNSFSNTLSVPKEEICKALKNLNTDENVRSEKLTMDELKTLFYELKKEKIL